MSHEPTDAEVDAAARAMAALALPTGFALHPSEVTDDDRAEARAALTASNALRDGRKKAEGRAEVADALNDVAEGMEARAKQLNEDAAGAAMLALWARSPGATS